MTTVHTEVNTARARLQLSGLDPEAAWRDAEVLARAALGWDKATYLAHGGSITPLGFRDRSLPMLDRRARHEPVSLIIGQREFWGLEFDVTPDVITPRPETELVVAEALQCMRRCSNRTLQVVDVGTGSGCIAVAIAHEDTRCQITATDVSLHALAVARRNAIKHGVARRVSFVCASLLDGIAVVPKIIVANLPYVPTFDLETLPPDVREFEPPVALAGGADGLETIRRLVDVSSAHLETGGMLVVEFGMGQGALLRRHVSGHPGLRMVRVRRDLQDLDRVAVIEAL